MKHFVAKLVKSFGRLGVEADSLDDFRYRKACSFGIENCPPATTERGGDLRTFLLGLWQEVRLLFDE